MKAKAIHEVRLGLILVRVFRKKTRSGIRHTLTMHRLFRNGDHWTESTRFGRDDIPPLRLALDHAHTWIFENGTPIDSELKQHYRS